MTKKALENFKNVKIIWDTISQTLIVDETEKGLSQLFKRIYLISVVSWLMTLQISVSNSSGLANIALLGKNVFANVIRLNNPGYSQWSLNAVTSVWGGCQRQRLQCDPRGRACSDVARSQELLAWPEAGGGREQTLPKSLQGTPDSPAAGTLIHPRGTDFGLLPLELWKKKPLLF